MKMQSLLIAVSTAALCVANAGAAFAQAAAPAAPPPIAQGPSIPGLCILSQDGVFAASTVGKYVQTRLNQIGTQVQSELTAEQTAIATEAKAVDAAKASLDQTAYDQKASAVQIRANAFQRKAQLREREMQATQQKAISRVGQELEPVIRAAYQQAHCSVLFQRDAIVIASPAMDITPAVITGVNAKITQFAFDRERLDQTAPAAPPTR